MPAFFTNLAQPVEVVEQERKLASSPPPINIPNLPTLLAKAAQTTKGVCFYSPGGDVSQCSVVSYADLQDAAKQKARQLFSIMDGSRPRILLLHFDNQRDNIEWFWAATLAGIVPAISTPFVQDAAQRTKHLQHLQTLLKGPVILTSKNLVPEFLGLEGLNLHEAESLSSATNGHSQSPVEAGSQKRADDVAVLMLTSGSSGNAKAVPLRHGQLLRAVRGKSMHHGTARGDVFLNWVGLDHVASLTEIHLHAMSLSCDQIHVPAAELLRDPTEFIRLLSEHKVTYTFAPNSFLAKVRDSLVEKSKNDIGSNIDLSPLKALISGGEANVVATCEALTQELRRFGVKDTAEVIRPGFGMSETCAGSIYSKACPSSDLARGLEFANLGTCIPGLEMRVMMEAAPGAGTYTVQAQRGEVGSLQLRGPVVFDHYFNNPTATAEAFTPDGWFITGDLARLDEAGNLHLAGRTKDTIIVNGVKWSSTEIEVAIEEENIPGVTPSFTVAFPYRATGSQTEEIAVVYSPSYASSDSVTRTETANAIAKVVSMMTGRAPARLVPLPQELLEKSSLGKISRTKVRAALEAGEYEKFEKENNAAIAAHRESVWRSASTPTEKTVQAKVAEILEIPTSDISMDHSIFDLGITSFNLILLKARIQDALKVDRDIPMSILLTEPSVGTIAKSIDTLLSKPQVYTPIVPLQPHGSKTPLFCIHPGSGDILVFIALAAHFPTRPVYALRSRGYNPNERLFSSLRETAETYAEHIRMTQPHGPYAIAGYSLGSTLAYEVVKVLEAAPHNQEVKFCASIDYPPHVAPYVHTLNWVDVLMHIAFFLELVPDERDMVALTPKVHALFKPEEEKKGPARNACLAYVLEHSDQERAKALAIDINRLGLITDIAENFRVNIRTYEPIGKVERLDVFVADPPTYAARDRQDWRENKLGAWAEFSKTETLFHDCPGIHAKMLNREHMADFARIFKAAMKKRGV